ncbi:MAG: 16S rRNA (adenine(1518)-N(6)/adenine(1519)-N(6))-dimethyltransferase RsmA [Alistipes sp.]|nr:16S rRNA (adenine(1518)-N(6)/adenine(1519)-N(6))-dimethyltransferase RsmA [Alistipes sp.]
MYVTPKKYLGQHFLTDLKIAQRIAESLQADPCRTVLEVGCGTGVLTQFLLARPEIELYGAEVDRESVAYLHQNYPAFTPRLIEGDFLQMNLRERFPQGVNVIGNFPYNISSQIFFKILEYKDLVPEVVGMVQREVAVRIAEPPGSRAYGILSLFVQAFYEVEYLFTVDRTVFNPPPKVQSAVLRLTRNKVSHLDCDEALFVRLVKALFNQRRKTIRNSMRAAFGDLGGAEHPDFPLRPEVLSVDRFVALTRWLSEQLSKSQSPLVEP